jgi:Right handed beta helix region
MNAQSAGSIRSRTRQGAAAAATITVVGGTLVVGGQPVSAAAFVVTSAADDGSGGLTLREAITAANASAGVADAITFAPGLSGSTITLTAGRLPIKDDLTITGLGQSALTLTTIAGDILYLYNGASLSMSNITLTGGKDDGIRALNSGDLVLSSVTVTASTQDGVHFTSPGADLTMLTSNFDDNLDDGVYVGGAANVIMTSTTSSSNVDTGLYIGGSVTGSVALSDVVLSRNTIKGLYLSAVGGGVTVSRSTIDENLNGGVHLTEPVVGSLSVVGTTIDGNTGDGVLIDLAVGAMSITDSSISDNTTNGLRIVGTVAGATTITGSNLDRNSAGDGFSAAALGGALTIGATSSSGNGSDGMNLLSVGGDLTLTTTTISTNAAQGLITDAVSGNAIVSDSIFQSNGGSGFYVDNVTGDATVSSTLATGNGNNGLYLERVTGDITIKTSELRNNGDTGAEIEQSGGNVTVVDTVFGANSDSGLYIDNVAGGNVVIERVTAIDNVEQGLYIHDVVGTVTVSDTTVVGSDDAGIDFDGNTGAMTIERTTVSGSLNEAVSVTGSAGGLAVVNSTLAGGGDAVTDAVIKSDLGAPISVAHSTISGNGIAGMTASLIEVVDAAVTVDHTIVTDNNGAPVFKASGTGTVAVTNSLTPVGSSLGTSNVESNAPLLGPLADNGGPTKTRLPLIGSPAIDAGSPTLPPATAPATDQRGSFRIINTIDIGAVEVAGPAVTSLAPARFVDTRDTGDTFDDRFQAEGKRSAGSEYIVDIAGRGAVPANAKAVVINVTAVAADGLGFVTVHPCVSPLPLASSLNYTAGVNLANEIVAPLSATGDICLYTSEAAHLLVDVVGFVASDSPTVPVTPARYLDTRLTGETFDTLNARSGPTGPNSTYTLKVAGRGTVPADAAAVIVNVTAVGPTEVGFVTVHPCAATPPNASSLNYAAGVNRANELIASVDPGGNICLFTSSSVNLLVDVVGYMPAGSSFNPVEPVRYLDTRANGETIDGLQEKIGKRTPGSQLELQITGRPGVPAGAKAVVVNVTAVQPEAVGFVTVHPCLPTRPNASSLNHVAGVNGANELIASLDATGKICLYTDQSTHLIVDVVGYLT